MDGVDHDTNAATDVLSYAGIMTSTRRATGGSIVVSYNSFFVQEITPVATPFEAHVNFQDNPDDTTPPSGYVADYGLAYSASSVSVGSNTFAYGWKEFSNGTPIDVTGNGGAGETD